MCVCVSVYVRERESVSEPVNMWASAYLFQSLHFIIWYVVLVVLLEEPLILISTRALCKVGSKQHADTFTLITLCSRRGHITYNVHGLQIECVGMSLDLIPIPARMGYAMQVQTSETELWANQLKMNSEPALTTLNQR